MLNSNYWKCSRLPINKTFPNFGWGWIRPRIPRLGLAFHKFPTLPHLKSGSKTRYGGEIYYTNQKTIHQIDLKYFFRLKKKFRAYTQIDMLMFFAGDSELQETTHPQKQSVSVRKYMKTKGPDNSTNHLLHYRNTGSTGTKKGRKKLWRCKGSNIFVDFFCFRALIGSRPSRLSTKLYNPESLSTVSHNLESLEAGRKFFW